MKISAVVPTYNNEDIIEECLTSLLNQSRKFDDIIVVDNASTDKTRDIVSKFPVKTIFLERNMERCYSRNTGWKAAKGDVIAIIESDSVYNREWGEKILECFEAEADAVIDRRTVYNPKTFISKTNDEFFRVRMDEKRYKPFSAWVYKRDVLEKLNGYDEVMVGFEDTELGDRLIKKGYKIMYQPQAIQYHKGEPTSLMDEFKRAWWFGVRTHKYYKKYPKKVPYTKFALFSYLTISILIPPLFSVSLLVLYLANLLRFLYMYPTMKPIYAIAGSGISIMRFWVFFMAYLVTIIDKKRRR